MGSTVRPNLIPKSFPFSPPLLVQCCEHCVHQFCENQRLSGAPCVSPLVVLIFSTRSVLASFVSCVVLTVLRSMTGAVCRLRVLSLLFIAFSAWFLSAWSNKIFKPSCAAKSGMLHAFAFLLSSRCCMMLVAGWLFRKNAVWKDSQLDLSQCHQPQEPKQFPHRCQTRDWSEHVQMLCSSFLPHALVFPGLSSALRFFLPNCGDRFHYLMFILLVVLLFFYARLCF